MGASQEIDLEDARRRWLRETEDPDRPGSHDFSGWPQGLLAYHVRAVFRERAYLRAASMRQDRRAARKQAKHAQ